MRFAAVPLPTDAKNEPMRSPAAEFVRKLLGSQKAGLEGDAADPRNEPPLDLDQRVRLAGEW